MRQFCIGVPATPSLGLDGIACSRIAQDNNRCPDCTTEFARRREARRGSPRDRGYDAKHERTRRHLIAHARKTGENHCYLCSTPIDLDLPGTHPQGPQLHHVTGKLTPTYSALTHAICNQRAGDPTRG